MGKRLSNDGEYEDMQTLRRDIQMLNTRMEEVLIILGGNSSYGVKGIRSDFNELKTDVQNIKAEIKAMKEEDKERDRKSAFFSVKLETIPQKIAGIFAFIIMVLTVVQSLRTLFSPIPTE